MGGGERHRGCLSHRKTPPQISSASVAGGPIAPGARPIGRPRRHCCRAAGGNGGLYRGGQRDEGRRTPCVFQSVATLPAVTPQRHECPGPGPPTPGPAPPSERKSRQFQVPFQRGMAFVQTGPKSHSPYIPQSAPPRVEKPSSVFFFFLALNPIRSRYPPLPRPPHPASPSFSPPQTL